jgi:hypothetical protein
VKAGYWLCMPGAQGPAQDHNALVYCQDVGDWRYRIFRGDGVPAPVGWWLAPQSADNTAIFVNQANIGDFDGEAFVFDWQGYV